MAVIGIGIVGCGGNGLNHAEVWSSIDEAKIIGVCDIDEARAKERADLLGVKAFTRVEDLVAEPGVDAVDVVTSSSHRDPAVVAAEAGKPFIVENPFANTVEDADDMIAAGEKAGIPMMYGQTHRFYAHSLKAKELIDGGEVGDPISVTISALGTGNPSNVSWHRWKAQGGGFFIYEGTHITDQLKWLMNSEVKTVYTVGMGRYVLEGDGEDNGIAGFAFENGGFGTLHHGTTIAGARVSDWRLIGTNGMLDVGYASHVRLGKDGKWQDVPFPDKDGPPIKALTGDKEPVNFNGFKAEFKEFLDSIAEGRQPSCSAYDGRASTAAAQAVLKSHETGLPVHL